VNPAGLPAEEGTGTSPRQDATSFWIDRGAMAKTQTAVSPTGSDSKWNRWTRQALQAWTIRRARALGGDRMARVADLGCGFGDWTAKLAELADEIIACDVSPGFVAEAQARLAGHPAAHVHVADVRTFDDYADCNLIYLGGVMTYLGDEDSLALLKKVRTRLAPGGVLLGRDWCAIGLGRQEIRTAPWFSMHRRPERYAELARQAGYEIIEVTPSPYIYGEQLAGAGAMTGPLKVGFRAITLHWLRGSVSYALRPA